MIKRSVVVQGHATSVRLEPEFWAIIDEICKKQNISLAQLIVSIEKHHQTQQNLASQLRVFCLTSVNNCSIPAIKNK
ncbi:MAG: aryl-sulfate sulfotransferase [Verrucomicrobia bacterium]|nr:aryl-sulfate sulfotransferase [Verrucomicrobiota bacterium]